MFDFLFGWYKRYKERVAKLHYDEGYHCASGMINNGHSEEYIESFIDNPFNCDYSDAAQAYEKGARKAIEDHKYPNYPITYDEEKINGSNT